MAYLQEERDDLLFRNWGLVKVSDRLYGAIIQEVIRKIGAQLRKITWTKVYALEDDSSLELQAIALGIRNPSRKMKLEAFIFRIERVKEHLGEVEVLIRLPIHGSAWEQEAFVRRISRNLKLPSDAEIYGGGIRIRIVLRNDFLPCLVNLPLNQRTNGHGQQGWVTLQEYLSDKYSPIR